MDIGSECIARLNSISLHLHLNKLALRPLMIILPWRSSLFHNNGNRRDRRILSRGVFKVRSWEGCLSVGPVGSGG